MPFTIADNDEVFNANQAVWMQTDINALVAGIGGDGVVSGCAVTAQGSPDMTLAVASGTINIAGTAVAVSSGNVTITTANATNPRIDLVVVSNAGTKSVTAGTAATNPKAPDIPANSILLAMIYVPANQSSIGSTLITDKRAIVIPTTTFLRTLLDDTDAAAARATLGTIPLDGTNAVLFDDFLGPVFSTTVPVGSLMWLKATSGAGAAVDNNVPTPDVNSPGIVNLSTGTTTTGFAGMFTGTQQIRFSGGAYTLAFRFQMPSLVDGTESGSVYIGFGDNVGGAPSEGAYVFFSNASANFRYRTRNNAAETDVDSALVAVAATWYKVVITVNAAGTNVNFTINGGNSQDLTTNIPTASGRETGLFAQIIKSAGTTARALYLDYMRLAVAMTSRT